MVRDDPHLQFREVYVNFIPSTDLRVGTVLGVYAFIPLAVMGESGLYVDLLRHAFGRARPSLPKKVDRD